MIQYGLISQTDARCLEKTIDLICKEFPQDNVIDITELGLFNCETTLGLMHYVISKGRLPMVTGVDNEKDKPILWPKMLPGERKIFIQGNTNEVYHKLTDNSQHLIFVDACHCFTCVISDFFAYAPKVKKGGYLAFHDTGKHIKPFKDFQHGDKNNPDAYISVRKALDKIGLLYFTPDCSDHEFVYGKKLPDRYRVVNGMQLIFDEADETNPAGGVAVFKKLY